MGFDPYEPSNWTTITKAQIIAKGGRGLLRRFDDSLGSALQNTFPELDYAREKRKPKGYWGDLDNRRKFFFDFAHDMGFDPLKAENWNSVTNAQILAKHGRGLLGAFNDSLRDALHKTLPELKQQA